MFLTTWLYVKSLKWLSYFLYALTSKCKFGKWTFAKSLTPKSW